MQRGIFSMQQACPHCGGRGKTITNPCKPTATARAACETTKTLR